MGPRHARRAGAARPRVPKLNVGVDLGGTKVLAVALDGEEVRAKAKRPTPTSGADDVVATIARVVRELGVDDVAGVGIGAPGVVDPATGLLTGATNLNVDADLPLGARVADALSLPADRVVVDNDVNVATVAEQRAGAAKGARDALCIFVGTGVGGGLVLDGQLRRGPRGLTGEIGHTVVVDGGRRCACGGMGHLEAYAGRRALEDEARRRHRGGRETALVRIAGDGRMKSSVFEAALEEGDLVAEALLEQAADALGAAIASAVALVDLEVVVVGGGLANRLGRPFLERIDAAAKMRMFGGGTTVRIVPAALGDLGGAMGAAFLLEEPHGDRAAASP